MSNVFSYLILITRTHRAFYRVEKTSTGDSKSAIYTSHKRVSMNGLIKVALKKAVIFSRANISLRLTQLKDWISLSKCN